MPEKYEHVQIDPTASIADDVTIGPWSVIGPDVTLCAGVSVGAQTILKKNVFVDEHTAIDSHVVLGGDPQHLAYGDENTHLHIGKRNVIREFVTMHRGTPETNGETRVGDDNYFMSYSHVAHDCQIGSHNVFANNASCAGHVSVGDHVVLGAFAGIHQFCVVGDYAFLGRASKVARDILPYVMVTGNLGYPRAVNAVGLKRASFSRQDISAIKQAFRMICRDRQSLASLKSALATFEKEHNIVRPMLDMLMNSKRGVARYHTASTDNQG